jgi:hypothetical protein
MKRVYRLTTPTLGLETKNGTAVPIVVPEGALIILQGSLPEAGLIECLWEGKAVSLFSIDIKERGMPTKEA